MLARRRRHAASALPRIDPETWAIAEVRVREDWSPEQIAGTDAVQSASNASTSASLPIGNAVAPCGSTCAGASDAGTTVAAPHGNASVLAGAASTKRPAMVERRDRAGYWDGDTGVGKGTARIVTLVDRKSGWVRLCKVPDGTATAVAEAVLSVLDPVRARVHTLTWDDGSEFAEHRLIDTGRGQQLLRDAVLVLAAWFPSSAVGDVSC